MRRARRFVRINFIRQAAVLAVCTLLLVAPVILGRYTEPRYAVSPVGVLRDSIIYTLTDTDRRITVSHRLDAADITDAQWLTAPPLIVQRVRGGGTSSYTVSALEPAYARLTPLMHLTTGANVVLIAASFAVRETPDEIRAAAYLPDGAIWATDSGGTGARLLATVDPDLQFPLKWSPDGATIAVKDNRYPSLMLVRAADGQVIRAEVPADSWAVWSPDSRYVLLTMPEVISRNTAIAIVDAKTGNSAPQDGPLSGRVARWCGMSTLTYVVQHPDQTTEVRLTNLASGQTTTVMPPESLPGHVVTTITPVEGHDCDWLLIGARTFNEQGTRTYLASPVTGEFHMIGHDAQVMAVNADALEYDLIVGGVRTRRTAALK